MCFENNIWIIFKRKIIFSNLFGSQGVISCGGLPWSWSGFQHILSGLWICLLCSFQVVHGLYSRLIVSSPPLLPSLICSHASWNSPWYPRQSSALTSATDSVSVLSQIRAFPLFAYYFSLSPVLLVSHLALLIHTHDDSFSYTAKSCPQSHSSIHLTPSLVSHLTHSWLFQTSDFLLIVPDTWPPPDSFWYLFSSWLFLTWLPPDSSSHLTPSWFFFTSDSPDSSSYIPHIWLPNPSSHLTPPDSSSHLTPS